MKRVMLEYYIKRYDLTVKEKKGKIVSVKYPHKGEMLDMVEIKPLHWRAKAEGFVFSFTL